MNNNEFKIVIKIKDYIKVIDNYIVNIPKKELYLKVPRLQELEDELNTYSIKTVKTILMAEQNKKNELIQSGKWQR